MRIATFNMENIFHRNSRLITNSMSQSLADWKEEFETLMGKRKRSSDELGRMRDLSLLMGFHRSALEPYVVMRRRAGQLYLRKRNDTVHGQKANRLTNWNGWIQLNSRPVPEAAIRNKARVISEVNPDVLILQEVEDRQSLLEFNEEYLPPESRFSEVVVLPGNNPHGLEMGIMTRNGYRIQSLKSHVNDAMQDEPEPLFGKDLQEYELAGPTGKVYWILSAHLQAEEHPDEKRKAQARKIAEVYQRLREKQIERIVVAGTFNAASYSDSLAPLLRKTDLQEITRNGTFTVDVDRGKDAGYHSLGAYSMGVNLKQKDYLLLSPELFQRVRASGFNRKGIWPERKEQWKVYASMKSVVQQASSHPIVWGIVT